MSGSPTPSSNQKTPHNRTLSDSRDRSTKVDTSSITPPEDAELRRAVNNIMFNHMGAEGWNGSTSALVYIASIDDLMQLFDKQASRIRAEVLDEVEQIIQRDFVHDGSSAAFDEGRKYEQFLNKQAFASLRQKPGERGQR